MRIGVDATCCANRRGFGRHARSLLAALLRNDTRNRYTLFADSPENAELLPGCAEVRLVRTSSPAAISASANGHRPIRDMLRMGRALSDPELELLFFPTIYSYVPVLSRARKLVMIHDVTAETYPSLALGGRVAQMLWNAKVALGRWQADGLVTVSEYSRQGIIRQFGTPPERIAVVGEASDPVFRVLEDRSPTDRLRELGIAAAPGRLLVYVGGFSPHKNLSALLTVFDRIARRPDFSDVNLLLVGEHDNDVFYSCFLTIRNQVEALGLGPRVMFTGYLCDEDLVALLNLATALVLPSLTEGFGLPAVEAAACGCPVIATMNSPLPALLGEGGLYIDPARPEALREALERVLESEELRRAMSAAGLVAARRLSWDSAARQMISTFENLVAQ